MFATRVAPDGKMCPDWSYCNKTIAQRAKVQDMHIVPTRILES